MAGELLYFMHPINTYDTQIEAVCLALIAHDLPEWTVENPNHPRHGEGYERYAAMEGKIGMDYFTEEVLPPCRGGIYLPFADGMIGAGIWKEADWLSDRGFPLWELKLCLSSLRDQSSLAYSRIERAGRIPEERRLGVDATRERIRLPDRSRRPFRY